MAVLEGWQKYLHLTKEATWGVHAGPDHAIYVPFTNYDVRVRPESVRASLYAGLRQRRHHRVARARVRGAFQTLLFANFAESKSVAEHLLSWLFSGPQSVDLESWTGELFEAGVDNKRHRGLRPARGVVKASAREPSVTIDFELEGKDEEGGASVPALPISPPRPIEFLFKDVSLTIAGDEVPLVAIELEVNNNLTAHHLNSYWPSLLAAGPRDVELRVEALKISDSFDAWRRLPEEERTAELVFWGSHGGSGPGGTLRTKIQIEFARLGLIDAGESGAIDELARQEARLIALRPSSASDDVAITCSTTS